MKIRSHAMDGSQVIGSVMRKIGSVVSSAVAGLALTAMALGVMGGCARVSTAYVQKSTDRLARPALILVHDYQLSPNEVQLDSAISSQVERAVKGTKTEDRLKVEQEVSRTLTTTLVDEIRKLGIPAEPARLASPVAGPILSIEGQIVSIDEGKHILRDMKAARRGKEELADAIVARLIRQLSTAVVLFHHAVAERLGLGSTDHKCLDLLREREPMSGSDLAAITGLTSGAITGVVNRLEEAGYLRREANPSDGRRQILSPVSERVRELDGVFQPLRDDIAVLLESFDADQLTAIALFLSGTTDHVYHHTALLRARKLSVKTPAGVTGQTAIPARGRSIRRPMR